MKAPALISILTVAFGILVSALYLAGNSGGDNPSTQFYENNINKNISRCFLKASLFNDSRFKFIRESATLAKKKAAFLVSNKDLLINDMIEKRIGKKLYHIETYLNKRFQESSQKKDNMAHQTAAMEKIRNWR